MIPRMTRLYWPAACKPRASGDDPAKDMFSYTMDE